MTHDIFGDPLIAQLGPWPVTATMLTSLLVSVLLIGLAALLAHSIEHRPRSRLAALGRLSVAALHKLVAEAVGRPSPNLEIFAGSLFLFVATSAVLGQLPGVTAPTANLGATSALAALVFFAVPVAGIRARGAAAYFKEYFRPNPILFPLHMISELSRTLALALRLFGNMMSGHLIVALIVALVGLLIPVPLMALDLLIGLLQAYIFTILTCVYIGAALRAEEGERP